MKYFRILISALLIAAAAAFYVFWNSDARVVRRDFDRMLSSLEKTGPESLPVAALKVDRTVSHFTMQAVVDPGEPFPGPIGRSELKVLLLKGREQADAIRVDAVGYDIRAVDDERIEMDVTVNARASLRGYDEETLGVYRVDWTRGEGDWRIASIAPLEIVKRPDTLPVP